MGSDGMSACSVDEVATRVLGRAREASGGVSWATVRSVHTRATIATGGLHGWAESWDDVIGGRYLETFALGPTSGAEGFDGHLAWRRDSAGHAQSRDRESDRRAAVNEAYRRSRAYWFPTRRPGRIGPPWEREDGGRRFDVVPIAPLEGESFELWIDASTSLIDRTVERIAGQTRTVRFCDYRTVGFVRLPFRQRITTGDPRQDIVIAVDGVELNEPVDADRFALPGPPEPDFAFSSDRQSTAVPFELVGNHVYVQARLDGRGPFAMLCDTGGQHAVAAAVAAELGLPVQGALQWRGVGEATEDVGVTRLRSVQIGEATLTDQVFAVLPFTTLRRAEGVPLAGIIGHELFKRFVVTIDYGHRRLSLTLPSAFSYTGRGTPVPVTFNGAMPQVEGEVDGVRGRFDLDTGSRAGLTLLRPFGEAHGLAERYRPGYEAVTGWGIGGPSRARVIRVGELRLGDVSIAGVIGELSTQAKGAFTDPHAAGMVGGGVLKRFNVTFDYSGRRVIFERNANDRTPDAADRAGLWLNLGDDSFEVADVVEASPAADAGIARGDRILALDGGKPPGLTLADARQALRAAPGTRVRLTVESPGGVREAVIVLRELV